MNCIHVVPPSNKRHRAHVYRHRANNMAAKMFVKKTFEHLESPIQKLRQHAQAICWKPLEGIVGACMAKKYHEQSDLVHVMAERMTQRIKQVLE